MPARQPFATPPIPGHRRALAALILASLTFPGAAMDQEQRIDDSARQSLAVTIYNDDLALIKDQRRVRLDKGENRLAWRNVSVRIRPETALLNERSGALGLTLLEQNFDYDLLTPASLLKKYLGREIEVVRTNDAGERTAESATVLAVNEGLVLRYADRIETQVVGHLAFPDVPADLRDQPTLVLHLQSGQAGEGTLELSYLTGGLSWKADYVADLAEDAQTMNLNGWVTLTNASGVAYPKARLQLVAGEVNRAVAAMPMMEMRGIAMAASPPMPAEENLAEYHLYTLPRPTDILDQQTKQVALLAAARVPVTRELVVQGQAHTYSEGAGDGWSKRPVESMLKFVNRDGDLGIPLPKGVVRVYSKDSQGHAQFIGEDGIDHTPRNATLNLKLGESFDVTARRKQTAFKKLGGSGAYDYAYEASFVIELKNAKFEPVQVLVRETIPGDWSMTQESLPHVKEASNLAAWTVEVPADGEVTLSWRVQVRH
ncbi:DUF4139 domain-containing protein [Thiocystis violacea]|uniref:DUF4139 domain-containing protein n=1 Tax=Thiocystis violacea TaxID=13725 RepID=UPI001907FEC4|nr:DUF4139 domain-containing protein [Thiocystis violacea]MBK1719917.1 DUF4139 domain-containing protein [Thiocystis violacea]